MTQTVIVKIVHLCPLTHMHKTEILELKFCPEHLHLMYISCSMLVGEAQLAKLMQCHCSTVLGALWFHS